MGANHLRHTLPWRLWCGQKSAPVTPPLTTVEAQRRPKTRKKLGHGAVLNIALEPICKQ